MARDAERGSWPLRDASSPPRGSSRRRFARSPRRRTSRSAASTTTSAPRTKSWLELLTEVLGDQLALLVQRQQAAEDVAERVAIAHRHLLAAAREDADWGWLLVRLDVSRNTTNAVLGAQAMRDLREGMRTGRFATSNPRVALQASGGARARRVPGCAARRVRPRGRQRPRGGRAAQLRRLSEEAAQVARRRFPRSPRGPRDRAAPPGRPCPLPRPRLPRRAEPTAAGRCWSRDVDDAELRYAST